MNAEVIFYKCWRCKDTTMQIVVDRQLRETTLRCTNCQAHTFIKEPTVCDEQQD